MTVKQALLLASYGTTHAEARARGIGALASEAAAAFPRRRVMEAYMSPKVRRVLQARGEGMPGPAEVLRQLRAEGREDLLVQPCLVAGARPSTLCWRGYGCRQTALRAFVLARR